MHSFTFATASHALPSLAKVVMSAHEVGSRNGRAMELTHVALTLKEPWKREIVNPDRRASIAAQIAETMWVLAGRNDIEWLSHYLPRAKDYSDDGKTWRGGYGPRIRAWKSTTPDVDQLKHVVHMLKETPITRQAVIGIYNPSVDLDPGKDIPCNDFLMFSSRLGKLDLHVTIRSNDLIWGWSGINAFEWSALLEIVAGLVGVGVGQLHFSINSLHIYEPHWKRACDIAAGKVLDVPASPRFDATAVGRDIEKFDSLVERWFEIEVFIREGRACSSEISTFPEPMLKSWLEVLDWWWNGRGLEPNRLGLAASMGIKPPRDVVVPKEDFLDYVEKLHAEKHAAYGNSWKKRGEMLGILANIARKIDRLGGTDTADETSLDTALDLMVYLAKYRWWQYDTGKCGEPIPSEWDGTTSDQVEPVHALLRRVEIGVWPQPSAQVLTLERDLVNDFQSLEDKPFLRPRIAAEMLEAAYLLARTRWEQK